MTTNETILEELLNRLTNPKNQTVNEMDMQMFVMVVKSDPELVGKAHKMIVKKMHSPNILEANRAIGLLEECMTSAGVEFQNKTAKYTFLNEVIALVLDKHSGPKAPVETKKRIMESLMLWTVEHSDKPKIQNAYDSIKKQVDFEVPAYSQAANNTKEQRTSILGKDDQLFAKLLKEGGEENYKKANLVIQRRFNQEARRTEFLCHLKLELKKIENALEVFGEMLNSYNTDTPGAESRETIQELYNMCKGYNEQMARWPDFVGDTEPGFLNDVLITKDQILLALHRYKELFEGDTLSKASDIILNKVEQSNIMPSASTTPAHEDLLSDLLGESPKPTSTTQKSDVKASTTASLTALDELADIFGNVTTENISSSRYPSDLLDNLDLLQPTNVEQTKADEEKKPTTPDDDTSKKLKGFKELREIDKLSEEMFNEILSTKQRQTTFAKEPEKLTLNDLVKDKINCSLQATNDKEEKTKQRKTDEKTPPEEEKEKNNHRVEKNINIDDNIEKGCTPGSKTSIIETDIRCDPKTVALPVKPLAEIVIDLDDVTPLEAGHRMLFDDDDIQVSLNFTLDRPSAHVSVMVISVTNKSKLPVYDFNFEASVKKPCKVRLLPPTSTEMSPVKPFRPPVPINQIVLLLNTTGKPVDLTCIVGYRLGDDPDPIKENIVAKDIPYV